METKGRVIRRKQHSEQVGLSHKARWHMESAGLSPARVRPGRSATLWLPSLVAKVPACGSVPFAAGFSWLLGYIALSLAAARLVYWKHAWAFTWVPEELTGTLVHYFLGFHLVVAPLTALGAEVVREMGKIRRGGVGRPPCVLLRDLAGEGRLAKYLLNGVLAYCLICGSMVGYTNLKPAIHLLAPALCDAALSRGDRYLMDVLSLGGSLAIPRFPALTFCLDTLYFRLWSLACVALAASYRDRRSFWRLTAALCLAFGFSLPISLLWPSFGPAFCHPGFFGFLRGTNSGAVMGILWENHLAFLANPGAGVKGMGSGIAAMPSLHMTLAYLSLTALGREFPCLRPALCALLLAFAAATVYLGWHYLLDGMVGVALGCVVYWISGAWFPGRPGRGYQKSLD
jgi:membrane-associated phospholipid phosphatase/predicted DNA-binding transcriptional regulator AlpA